MSVLRQANWLGQQRVDVPHLRGIDSSVSADFDLLAGTMLTNRAPFVLQGFNLITLSAGVAATNLQISVSGGVLMHPLASEVGTIFSVAAGRTVETLNATNARVTGGFTASSVNYVGVDLRRSADSTTADLVQFLNANTQTESPQTVPLGRTLDYVFVIGTQDFSQTPTVAPLCKVTTDASNNIVTLEDARNMFGRLGKGGSVTTPLYTYPWPGGRTEVGNNSDFGAADKAIPSLKDWMDAIMTRTWEIGGGEHWYSPTGWHNVQMVRNGSTLFVSTGDYFEWTGSNLHWRELRFTFSNSTGWFNDVADQLTDAAGAYGTTATNLADGDCLYVDLDRTTNRTGGTALAAIRGVTATLGSPLVPGSRVVIAWRIGSLIFTRGTNYAIGQAFQVATVGALGVVKLHQAATTPLSPIVLSDGDLNTASGVPQFDSNRVLTIGVPTGGGNQTALLATGLGTGSGIQGTGGTGGIGVKGQGTTTGPGGDFTGGASGAGVVVHAVASNDAALIQLKDSAGNLRSGHDHVGYPMAISLIDFREDWYGTQAQLSAITNPIPGFQRWKLSACDAASTFNTSSSTGIYSFPMAVLGLGNTNGSAITLQPCASVAFQAYESFVIECDLYLHTFAGAWSIQVGFTGTNLVAFSASNASGFWQYVGNGSGALSTAVANDTLYTLRIECHGTASAPGSLTKWYINGSLVRTDASTSAQPNVNQAAGIFINATSADTTAGRQLFVGGVRMFVNKSLAANAL